MTTITPTSHPRIWAICLLILHDNGAINRIDPEPTSVTLPGSAVDLAFVNSLLARLTAQEIETFAIGEQSAAAAVALRFAALGTLHATLNKWFVKGMSRRWTT